MIRWRSMWGCRTALAVLIVILSLFLAACAKNPVTGQEELAFMSEPQEIAMGARYYPEVIQLNNGTPPEDPQLQAYVSRVGGRLARVSHRPNVPWQFTVVDSSQVNAFALPGGKICITRGLITKMSSEDELAGVLGHEIGHVTARHAVAAYTRQVLMAGAMLGLTIALADNDYAPALLAAAGVAGGLMVLSYSRDQERQSDELGYQYMTKAGYNPLAMVNTFELFKKMQKSEPGVIEGMLSSHPLPQERISAAEQRALSSPLSARPFHTAEFNRSLALQKVRVPAYAAMDKGNALAGKKRWSQAEAQYKKAIALYPKESMFYSRLAVAQMKQKQNTQALASARKGARLSWGNFYPNLILGMVANANRDYSLAVDAHRKAAQALPDHVINNFLLAYAHDKIGPRSQAVVYYRKVQRAAPSSQYGKAAQKRLQQMGYN
ncbi:MAG: M48 family metalloprotease [Proteobacteria bacterium]|nr:M48 family metalloprotease [Pseudomonadota bacterium]MBU4276103.1 M48 family metalloprotease [Pseudomonadota bacterium]MBU4384138.1 M48 family metalloprotease [Pseudomonadota bacterium]MBU4606821.1 M48 family metalloprotease [Pseudomonadota bacterium]MCG2763776.1 M48 family metalloprotease [Desulfarculaceae bacterium]